MTRAVVRPALIAVVTLIFGLPYGASAFQQWENVHLDTTEMATSPSGSTGALSLVRKAGRAVESFAVVGAGDVTDGFSPWVGTGIQWRPVVGVKLLVEGRALLPAPSFEGDTSSGLMGGLTIDVTGW